MRRQVLLWAPLALFILLVAALVYGLRRPDDTTHPSTLVGRRVPSFALAPALPGRPGLTSADLAGGHPVLVNVFASWCVPCAAEAPQLTRLAAAGVPIAGIAIRDRADDLARFLRVNGDPYVRIGGDPASGVQIALGSSGVPESFVVDGRGVIRLHKVGPINPGEEGDVIAALAAAR